MWFAQIATRLGPTREKKMQLEEEIREILFQLVKSITIHKIDPDNSVIEADYERYVKDLASLVNQTRQEADLD